MPLEPGSPMEWLHYANSDLQLAKYGRVDQVMLETLCFHAQQAAEKSIKAVLIYHRIGFPKIHSIERLLTLLPSSIQQTTEIMRAAELTDYATIFRYPGEAEELTEEEYLDAVAIAERVYNWAHRYITEQQTDVK